MKWIGLAVTFVAITTMLYFGVTMFGSIPAPEEGTEAHETYTNLTDIVSVSYSAFEGVLLLLIVVMMIVIVTYLKA